MGRPRILLADDNPFLAIVTHFVTLDRGVLSRRQRRRIRLTQLRVGVLKADIEPPARRFRRTAHGS